MNLSDWASITQIISVILPVAGSIYAVYRKIDKRQHVFETELKLITQNIEFITKQFGPNGGGLRQAVNDLTDTVSKIGDRQVEIGDNLAELTGKFEQHDKQAK